MTDRLKALGWPIVCGILAGVLMLQWFGRDNTVVHIQQNTSASAQHSYADAVEKASMAVVNIYTAKRVRESIHPFFRYFYNQGDSYQRERVERSLGSGVIVDKQGYILTNNHVISGADRILVMLQDGRESSARIIGTDPDSDLAILKVELDNLDAITLGNSNSLRVGDVVLAIGNPLGYGHTVTQGIISATNRYGLNLNLYENYIQTDAAINVGNSGGALIDSNGLLVGINTAITTGSDSTRGSIGLGFAIPVNDARKVLSDLVQYGQVIRGWLGVNAQQLNQKIADALGLDNTDGAVITAIQRGGPAHKAGLLIGDVIVSVNGQAMVDVREVMFQIANMKPGETLSLEIQRGNRVMEIDVKIGQKPQA